MLRLCKKTATGLEFIVGHANIPSYFKTQAELEKAMRDHPDIFEPDTNYTLHEDRAVFHVVSEIKRMVVRVDGK